MPQPDISLLMPARNAGAYLVPAIQSILAADQLPGSEDLELIVIDDGSTDGSVQRLTEITDPRLRVIQGPQRGVAAALNAGLSAATGRYIARCDADDLYPDPGRLSRQRMFLAANPDFVAICGGYSTMTSQGKHIARLDTGNEAMEITDELCGGITRTTLCTFLLRTETVRKLEGFRDWFVTAEDIDLLLRLPALGRIWYEPADEYAYRLHDASITHQQPNAARIFYEQTARTFAAQRLAGGLDDLQRRRPPVPPQAVGRATGSAVQIQNMLIGQSWREHRAGRKVDALRTGWRAVTTRPANPGAWRNLLALLLKSSQSARP